VSAPALHRVTPGTHKKDPQLDDAQGGGVEHNPNKPALTV
jgi:hypothetical protein